MRMKPISQIKVDLGINANGRVQAFLTDTCKKHMEKYVPYSGDGNNVIHLRENTYTTVNSVTYESPYAHYQYVNQFPEDHYTTPGTGPYWDKRMASAEIQDVIREVQEHVNRGK